MYNNNIIKINERYLNGKKIQLCGGYNEGLIKFNGERMKLEKKAGILWDD